MATSDTISDKAYDAKEQIAQLRRQVEQLMSERVTPALSDAAQRAQAYVGNASDMAREQTEAVSSRVREAPLLSILIAAATGYLIGRLFR
jgi:ElaB/YqjD/DUF883 family membrane-anchored ribosome-binding protein